jgi:hypothetical protein
MRVISDFEGRKGLAARKDETFFKFQPIIETGFGCRKFSISRFQVISIVYAPGTSNSQKEPFFNLSHRQISRLIDKN